MKIKTRLIGVPIIILSPSGGNKLAFECLQAGANAVLEVPIQANELAGTTWWLLRERLFEKVPGEGEDEHDSNVIPSVIDTGRYTTKK